MTAPVIRTDHGSLFYNSPCRMGLSRFSVLEVSSVSIASHVFSCCPLVGLAYSLPRVSVEKIVRLQK